MNGIFGTISLYDTNSGKLLATLNQSSSFLDYDVAVNSITFSNDGSLMVTVIEGVPVLWNLYKYTLINIEAGCIGFIKSIAFSQDDTLLMIAGDTNSAVSPVEGNVCIWKTRTGKLLTNLGGKNSSLSNFATFNSDGTML